MTPQACYLTEFGSVPPALQIEDVLDQEPAAHEVVLRMLAAPINPADLNVIAGTYGELPTLPSVIGNEGCGEVLACGDAVSEVNVGQIVIILKTGTWTQRMLVDASQVVPVPHGLDPLQAAMLSVNPATAWRMLHDFVSLQPGDWIVQNAANSGVGRAVIQLARALGIRTLNLVRRPELIDELLALGADVVTGEETDLRKNVRDLCAGDFPRLGFNAIGGASALNVANALSPDSTLVTYGAMSRQPLKIPNSLLIFKNLTFSGFWLRRWKESATPEEIRETYSRLADFLARGILYTPVQSVYPLARVGEAIQAASMEKRSGKVLLDFSMPDETH